MTPFPMISVLITSYNAQETIGNAVKSGFNQEWPNKEIIVYDDYSTDATVEILKRHGKPGAVKSKYIAELEPQIKILYGKENRGVAYARNHLINYAKGEFIAFFDDDDVSLPTRLETQYAEIIAAEKKLNSDQIICHTARKQIYSDESQRYEPTIGCNREITPFGSNIADRVLYGRISKGVTGSCATCSQMARKSIYTGLNKFDESFRRAEDTDFIVRFALAGGYFIGIDEPLVQQNIRNEDYKDHAIELDSYNLLMDKHSKYLIKKGWYKFNIKWGSMREYYLENKRIFFIYSSLKIFVFHPVKYIKRMIWSISAYKTRDAYKKLKILNSD